jgi:hypothetical protein
MADISQVGATRIAHLLLPSISASLQIEMIKTSHTVARTALFSIALLATACVPTVSQPLVVGTPATPQTLAAFAGTWQWDDDGTLKTMRVTAGKTTLRFSMMEAGKETNGYVVTVRQTAPSRFVFNMPSDQMFSAETATSLPVRPNEKRYFIAVAEATTRKISIHLMQQEAVLADIKSGAYAGDAWNMCLNAKVTAKTAVAPPPTVAPPCFQLVLTQAQLNDYIARHGRVVFNPEANLTLTR